LFRSSFFLYYNLRTDFCGKRVRANAYIPTGRGCTLQSVQPLQQILYAKRRTSETHYRSPFDSPFDIDIRMRDPPPGRSLNSRPQAESRKGNVSEGDTDVYFCGKCLRHNTIRFQYLEFESFIGESGDLLTGICIDCGKLISVPYQASHLLTESWTERKLTSCDVRLPRPLIDLLRIVSEQFEVPNDRFRQAMLRYYVHELCLDDQLIVPVMRMARSPLARQTADARLTLRLSLELSSWFLTTLSRHGIENWSMVIRGLILVGAQDVDSRPPNRRQQALSAIAASLG